METWASLEAQQEDIKWLTLRVAWGTLQVMVPVQAVFEY